MSDSFQKVKLKLKQPHINALLLELQITIKFSIRINKKTLKSKSHQMFIVLLAENNGCLTY